MLKNLEIWNYLKSRSQEINNITVKTKTKDNTYVAVKVQRPNLEFLIRRDVVILRFLATFCSPLLPLNIGVGIGEIID